MNAYHGQEYYYPNWIKEDSYTLYGTRLTPRNNQDPVTGYWANNAYEWGYVDNMGSDNLVGGNVIDGSGQRNGFKIANAIYHDGTPVKLAIYRLYQSSVWSIIEKWLAWRDIHRSIFI